MSENYEENAGGIYIILNALDCKAYVGQAQTFSNRTHLDDLMNNIDANVNLQKDYSAGKELIYFVPVIFEDPSDKESLNRYEKIYMTLMEDLGFTLYNIRPTRENRTWEKLQVSNEAQEKYKHLLAKDFRHRFQLTPEQLVSSSKKERFKVIDHYSYSRIRDIDKYKTEEFLKPDVFMFNRERAKALFNNKVVSYKSLSLDEMFLSSAGNYLGEGLDQILSYENNTIHRTMDGAGNGYCLWTFSNNAVSLKQIRKKCRDYHKKGKDVFVLFTYTPSTTYSYAEPHEHQMLVPEEKRELLDDEVKALHFCEKRFGRKKRLMVPDFVDTTSADWPNAAAFVIQEFALLKEQLNPNKLKESCFAVRANDSSEIKEYNRSTFYLVVKDNCSISDAFTDDDGSRKITFVGKLAAPYIIRLTGDYNK